jgi:hypothetical protein
MESPMTMGRRVLNGRLGEFVTIARHRGKDWFVGSITNWGARKLNLARHSLSPCSMTIPT